MRILVIQFLLGMFESSKDHVLLSTNPRSQALRELVESSPHHEFVMLSVNRSFKSELNQGKSRILFYDVPATRMMWILYLFVFALLTRPRLTISFGIEMTALASGVSSLTRSEVVSVIGSDIDYLNVQYRLPKPARVLSNAILRLALSRISHVFVPNQRVMGSVRRMIGEKTRVSEFKYKVSSRFAPSATRKKGPSDAPVILTVARLSPIKGLEYLVISAKEVIKSIPRATFVIQSAYPDPTYQSILEKMMIRQGVRDHFKFSTSPIPNSEMPRLYNSADLFVLPSLSEGRNSAVLEALACGLPVVATRVGANEEVILDGRNGFLVDPKDTSAMAECIIRILKDKEFSLGLSKSASASIGWSKELDLGTLLKDATADSLRETRRET